MYKKVLAAVLLSCLSCSCVAANDAAAEKGKPSNSSSQSSRLLLHTASKPKPLWSFAPDALGLPIKGAGNGVIFRHGNGVIYVANDAGRTAKCSASEIPGWANAVVADYAADGTGRIALLVILNDVAQKVANYAIANFDYDCKFKSLDLIGSAGAWRQLAFLDQQRFVILGVNDRQRGIVGLFDDRGQFERDIELKDDLSFPSEEGMKKEDFQQRAIEFGTALLTSFVDGVDGGGVTLMRRSATGPAFLIQRDLTVKKIKLAPVENGSLRWIRMMSNRIAAVYITQNPPEGRHVVLVLQTADGNVIRELEWELAGLGLAVMDATDNSVKVLTTAEIEGKKQLAVIEATP